QMHASLAAASCCSPQSISRSIRCSRRRPEATIALPAFKNHFRPISANKMQRAELDWDQSAFTPSRYTFTPLHTDFIKRRLRAAARTCQGNEGCARDDLIRQLFQIFRRFLEGVRRAVDIYEVMGDAYSGDNYRNVLYANPGNSNHWIKLKLEGVRS